jgi:hypothetical protein
MGVKASAFLMAGMLKKDLGEIRFFVRELEINFMANKKGSEFNLTHRY